MEGSRLWTDMLMGDDALVDGLNEFSVPMTQETHENADLPVEVEEVDVQPSQGVQQDKTKGLAKRTKNFDPKEDLIVCSAWLNVSKDPINGANQSRGTFWKRVRAYFEEHKTTPYVRTGSSIMHRWLTIQTQVNKYCACYEAIERRNQSGKTIQDKISDALELYKELDKDNKSFTLVPCWNKLKEEDKWKAKRVELAEQEKQPAKKKQRVNLDSTTKNVESTNNDDDLEVAAQESEDRKRPPGVKKAKEALKRGGGEACMEALDKLWAKKEAFDLEKEKKKEQMFLISLEVEKKRLSIEDKKAESDLIKEEKEIMTVDMSSLTPLQQQYYVTMQEKIIARRLAN